MMNYVDTVVRQTNMVGVRDSAVQKLRDLTIAIAIAASAGVGAIAIVSAATIPGSAATPGLTGNAPTSSDDQPVATTGNGFSQAPPAGAQYGPGVAVSGGSH